jgi:hypothetical protein
MLVMIHNKEFQNFLDKSNKHSQNHHFFHEICQFFHENDWFLNFLKIKITKIYDFFEVFKQEKLVVSTTINHKLPKGST